MKNAIAMTVLASVLVAGVANAAAPASAKDAAIHFADNGGIYSYQADSNHELYIQSRDRTWYKAELIGPCDGLEFANGIGFKAEPGGDFTKFGDVIVNGRSCKVGSLMAIEGKPPKKADKAK